MRVGIFGDAHLTKNMRALQRVWEDSALSSFINMYKRFDEENVDFVVGLGDLLDAPEIKAQHLHILRPVFQLMNLRSYPTYLLLGNHEIESDDSNILEYLSEYENIKPITDSDIIRNDFTFIPYNVNIRELDPEFIKDKILFTHHDIYGSELAGGKTRAYFGIETAYLKEAKLVFNGHVHLKSRPAANIINTGSLLASQQGELRLGDYPSYYIYDSESEQLETYDNKDSMIYLTIDREEIPKLISHRYPIENCVLKVEYEGSEAPQVIENVAHISFRKKISSIEDHQDLKIDHTTFDMKNYLKEYIQRDENVSEDVKENYISSGLELLK